MSLMEKIFPKEEKLISNESLIFNVLLFLIYMVLSFVTYIVVDNFLHVFLIWNLFLAAIPFAIVFFIDREIIKSKVGIIIVFIFWLFFFPNSIYIITDLIYINSSDFVNIPGMYESVIYIQDLSAYLALFHIYLGSIIGIIYGYKSLSVLYDLAKDTIIKKYRNLLVITVFLLSGIGIYIGRFFRYNSWELLKVFSIIGDFFSTISWFTVFFVLALTILQTLIFYGFKYNFIKKSLK